MPNKLFDLCWVVQLLYLQECANILKILLAMGYCFHYNKVVDARHFDLRICDSLNDCPVNYCMFKWQKPQGYIDIYFCVVML